LYVRDDAWGNVYVVKGYWWSNGEVCSRRGSRRRFDLDVSMRGRSPITASKSPAPFVFSIDWPELLPKFEGAPDPRAPTKPPVASSTVASLTASDVFRRFLPKTIAAPSRAAPTSAPIIIPAIAPSFSPPSATGIGVAVAVAVGATVGATTVGLVVGPAVVAVPLRGIQAFPAALGWKAGPQKQKVSFLPE